MPFVGAKRAAGPLEGRRGSERYGERCGKVGDGGVQPAEGGWVHPPRDCCLSTASRSTRRAYPVRCRGRIMNTCAPPRTALTRIAAFFGQAIPTSESGLVADSIAFGSTLFFIQLFYSVMESATCEALLSPRPF